MKSITLFISSLLLLSGSAMAQDYAGTHRASKAVETTFSGSRNVVEVTMRDNSRSSYRQPGAHNSHQHKFDDDAYLRRISYKP